MAKHNVMRRAVVLRVGAREPELLDSFDTSLANLQKLVGGYVEYVRPHPLAFAQLLADRIYPLEPELGLHWRLVVNEEGKLRGLKHNALATFVYAHTPDGWINGTARTAGYVGHSAGIIVGDAVLIEVD